MADFIMTIDSDAEGTPPPEVATEKSRKRKRQDVDDAPALMDKKFYFDGFTGGDAEEEAENVYEEKLIVARPNALPRVSIDEIIARRFQSRENDKEEEEEETEDIAALELEDAESDEEEGGDEDDEESGGEDEEAEDVGDVDTTKSDSSSSDGEGGEEEDPDDVEEEEDSNFNSNKFALLDQIEESDSEAIPLIDPSMPKDPKKPKGPNPAKYFSSQISKSSEPTCRAKSNAAEQTSFAKLGVSRTLLVALKSCGMDVPTLIQQEVIPVALTGADIVGSSQTGSGKTAAFVIPILERLLHRPRNPPQTRTLILAPTRELAVQIHGVVESLGRFTDIKCVLCVGGLSLSVQSAALKQKPEVVVSTPGRLIDHMRNSAGFEIEEIEILVIDEADRMMEEGFKDELEEIVKACSRSRQTMLFSATVSEDVSELARLSLQKPVRIRIDHTAYMSRKLVQEFIRVRTPRGTNEGEVVTKTREAILLALCLNDPTFNSGRTLIFFRSKAQAHRMKIIFSLLRHKTKRLKKAEELHGDLTQDQRLKSLKDFKDGKCGYLLCTDLASRGLDIKGVENVINFEVPKVWEVYLHRVGRTARAGREGRAVTLVGESDRKLVKEAVKNSSQDSVKHRTVPIETVKKVATQLEELQEEVIEVLADEKEEKELRRAEMEVRKGQNMILHEDEIKSRPARTWFQTKKEKQEAKGVGKRSHNAAFDGQESNKGKEKEKKFLTHRERRKKEARDEMKMDKSKGKGKGTEASIKAAKKAQQAEKVGKLGSHGAVDLRKAKKMEKVKRNQGKKQKERGETAKVVKKDSSSFKKVKKEVKNGKMAKGLKGKKR